MSRRYTGLKTRAGRRIMEGDYVLMHWGGGRYRVHKVTFHQEGNAIHWLLGAPDGRHTWNRWTGKDVRVIPARKGAALWRKREDVSSRLRPLGQHPMDKVICEMAEKAWLEAMMDAEKAVREGL